MIITKVKTVKPSSQLILKRQIIMTIKITSKEIISIIGLTSLIISGVINNIMGQSIDTEVYDQVLYRINAGGLSEPSSDSLFKEWEDDDFLSPSIYVNAAETGNKVFETTSPITLSASVPTGTPVRIFQVERGIENWETKSLLWNFPVEAGDELEVRLYFAELFFQSPGIREFDIYLNDSLVFDNYDIVNDVGFNTGVMKSFVIKTKSNNLKIDLARVKNHPKINAIEILKKKEFVIASVFPAFSEQAKVSVYPNPFNDQLTLYTGGNEQVQNYKLYNCQGKFIKEIKLPSKDHEVKIELHDVEKGIYYLSNEVGSVKLIKY